MILHEFLLRDVTVNFDRQRKPVRAAERSAGPYPYYGASGVVDHVADYLFDGEYLLVAEDGENLRTRKTPVAFIASGKFWANNHAHVLQGNELANTYFLAYAIERLDLSGYLTGSTQPKLTQGALNSIRLNLPKKPEQDAIVALLRALDDKIAVNGRIAAASEELCLAYFADQTGAAMVSVAELCHVEKKQIDPRGLSNSSVLHFSLPSFDAGRTPEIADPRKIKSLKFEVPPSAVLVSKLNPGTPRVWHVRHHGEMPAMASTEFLVLLPKEGVSTSELWAALSQPAFLASIANKVTGTSNSHQRVTPAEIMDAEIIDPRQFGQLRLRAEALLQRVLATREEVSTLRALRDTLLPELMSGRLRIKDAEDVVEEAV